MQSADAPLFHSPFCVHSVVKKKVGRIANLKSIADLRRSMFGVLAFSSPVWMHFPEPILVTLFVCEVAILPVARSLLLKALLGHHVQLSGTRQLCVAWS